MTEDTKNTFDHLIGRAVEFGSKIEECESYLEPGMWGRILSITYTGDECYRFKIKIDEFDPHNIPLETTNYYDKDGKPTLSARQAGHYQAEDDYYLPNPEDWDEYFVILAEGEDFSALLAEYIADPGTSRSYTHWLERKVLELKSTIAQS